MPGRLKGRRWVNIVIFLLNDINQLCYTQALELRRRTFVLRRSTTVAASHIDNSVFEAMNNNSKHYSPLCGSTRGTWLLCVCPIPHRHKSASVAPFRTFIAQNVCTPYVVKLTIET
ncbi:hypothetical protein AVEN_195209-1 [Araneus ventricosus]|uniref:Uncharacterized protein n=1 Tax=Araneus ventricosus TaxID=182803 RepID=A0A4Y2FZ35_ARAVE|nr:hypothetical protein AVEN_195209-1 [Araneus ventricosus]